MKPMHVLIVDDHALVRSGLRALLEAQPDLAVAGEAGDGATAVEQCRKLQPDLVIMDLAMPGRGGISAITDLRQECPQTKIVVLTMHEDETYARSARLAGAAGYVLKKSLATELIQTLRAVQAGQTVFPATDLPSRIRPNRAPLDLVTQREREVLALIARGHTTVEIASRLHISDKTVETHRAHLAEKLGLRTRADLVRFALDHGLLTP
jgi:two-component system response regulator NreC